MGDVELAGPRIRGAPDGGTEMRWRLPSLSEYDPALLASSDQLATQGAWTRNPATGMPELDMTIISKTETTDRSRSVVLQTITKKPLGVQKLTKNKLTRWHTVMMNDYFNKLSAWVGKTDDMYIDVKHTVEAKVGTGRPGSLAEQSAMGIL